MYAVMGITGQVGGAVARSLLESGKSVRGIVRDPAKALAWQQLGVQLVVAASGDALALAEAFRGTEGAFVMMPSIFAPSPDLREARAFTAAITLAIRRAGLPKVVALSTVGAHHEMGLGILAQVRLFEQAIRALPLPVTILRPAWFMENASWDVDSARDSGRIATFLVPANRAIPMVATADVGLTAGTLLLESWNDARIVELEGPEPVSPDALAAALGQALERDVLAVAVPREQWEGLFRSQGSEDPSLRIQMLEGFNSGWIGFEGVPNLHQKGRVPLSVVIEGLVDARAGKTIPEKCIPALRG